MSAKTSGPDISIIVCTLNGAERLDRCLSAVRLQSVADRMELIVVDDGSTDDSAAVAASYGADVVRHPFNRGLAAARNTAIARATAPVIATLDDDCEPDPQWAERLLAGFEEETVGVGGPAVAVPGSDYLDGYLERNNPLAPLEIGLSKKTNIAYRLALYLRRNTMPAPSGPRPVHAFATANGAFRLEALRKIGGFDEGFRSDEGGEDLDLCLRLGDEFGPGTLRFEPSATLVHHFDTDVRALLRRWRHYGRGAAHLYCKRGDLSPTVFPFPFFMLVLLVWSRARLRRLVPVLLLPQLLFPKGMRQALAARSAAPLLDSYMKLLEEANLNAGFMIGLWRWRARDR